MSSKWVEMDINKRWEQGLPHHPKSIEIFKWLSEFDFKYCQDSFCWKSGGDGDNGETLMFQLDVFFELLEQQGGEHVE